jgi:transketolase
MRVLPNMLVLTPGDPSEAVWATNQAIDSDGPVYLRLGRAGETSVHSPDTEFSLGRAVLLRQGGDATLLSAGSGLPDVVAAADLLEENGVSVRVLSFPSVKPLDTGAILAAVVETGNVFTVEEHSIIGGFGSAVSEFLLESGTYPRTFQRLGFPNAFTSKVGDQAFLRNHFQLDAAGIATSVLTRLRAG